MHIYTQIRSWETYFDCENSYQIFLGSCAQIYEVDHRQFTVFHKFCIILKMWNSLPMRFRSPRAIDDEISQWNFASVNEKKKKQFGRGQIDTLLISRVWWPTGYNGNLTIANFDELLPSGIAEVIDHISSSIWPTLRQLHAYIFFYIYFVQLWYKAIPE